MRVYKCWRDMYDRPLPLLRGEARKKCNEGRRDMRLHANVLILRNTQLLT